MANNKDGQRGKFWASATILFCGAYSVWANVTFSQIRFDYVVASVFPVGVLWLTSHTVGYYAGKGRGWIYAGLGLILSVSFYVSGFHIVDKTIHSGQPWYVAVFYPVLADFPIVVAFLILIRRMETTTVPVKETQTVIIPTKVTSPAKSAPKATPAPKRAPAKKTPIPTSVPKGIPLNPPAPKPTITADGLSPAFSA
jgi:hypothetical protein